MKEELKLFATPTNPPNKHEPVFSPGSLEERAMELQCSVSSQEVQLLCW